MTVRTYKFCNDCFGYMNASVSECVTFVCRSENLEIVFIQSPSKPSLRKIRRARKFQKSFGKFTSAIMSASLTPPRNWFRIS